MKNYDPNPLKDIPVEEAIYIHSVAPVGSELWRNSGYVLINAQQCYQKRINKPLKGTSV